MSKTKEVLTGITVVALAAGASAKVLGNKGAAHPVDGKAKLYRVKQDDSEWSIQEKAKVGGDPREFVYQLDKSLPKGKPELHPGDEVLLPESSAIGKTVMADSSISLPTYVEPKDE